MTRVSRQTGSTDCICFATVGTNDPVTSALHIIVGQWTSLVLVQCSLFNDKKKMYQNSVSALCVCVSLQVTLSRWTSAPFTTMTPFSVTQSRCSATVSMEMYRLTARGSGGLALPDTICQVCHHFPNLSDSGDGAGGGSVAPVLHGVHTCFY